MEHIKFKPIGYKVPLYTSVCILGIISPIKVMFLCKIIIRESENKIKKSMIFFYIEAVRSAQRGLQAVLQ